MESSKAYFSNLITLEATSLATMRSVNTRKTLCKTWRRSTSLTLLLLLMEVSIRISSWMLCMCLTLVTYLRGNCHSNQQVFLNPRLRTSPGAMLTTTTLRVPFRRMERTSTMWIQPLSFKISSSISQEISSRKWDNLTLNSTRSWQGCQCRTCPSNSSNNSKN